MDIVGKEVLAVTELDGLLVTIKAVVVDFWRDTVVIEDKYGDLIAVHKSEIAII